MSEARLFQDEAGRWCLDGVLDFDSVSHLLPRGETCLRGQDRLEIDLAGVTSANSAGLALLLEWLDMARAARVQLSYRNLPDSLNRIAAVSNLQSLLPVTAESHG